MWADVFLCYIHNLKAWKDKFCNKIIRAFTDHGTQIIINNDFIKTMVRPPLQSSCQDNFNEWSHQRVLLREEIIRTPIFGLYLDLFFI